MKQMESGWNSECLQAMAATFCAMAFLCLLWGYAGAASAEPKIQLNGTTDLVTLSSGAALTATIQLNAGDQAGDQADWWVAAETPAGWFYWQYPNVWLAAGENPGELVPSYQGPLFTLNPPLEVLQAAGLPAGVYTFYFGVDTVENGLVNEGFYSWDSFTVTDFEAYPVVDTGQKTCYNNTIVISCPQNGDAFFGQDAQYAGHAPSYTDNGDGTITDKATGLMWAQEDSGMGLNWEEALAWVQTKNGENYMGYTDWRLPNAKELQTIVDYTRSPDTTGSAAIDPLFHVTGITNEAGQADFPCYWSGATHANAGPFPGAYAAYMAFGRALGYMNGTWLDVHGAGAQRSDPKKGDPADYPTGHGPQGDAIRIFNYVRLLRDAGEPQASDVYVNPSDGACGGKSPCYASIQEGIDKAPDCSSINIAEGVYPEVLSLDASKTVRLKGGWNRDFSVQTPNATVIQSVSVGKGTLIMKNLVLRGATIQ